jgi:predicted membrane protein
LLFTSMDWDRVMAISNEQDVPKALEMQIEDAILFVVFFLAPVILLLFAGLGFILLRRRGWMLASIAQAIIMLACLFSFPEPRPGFVYPIIAYCILMILLLNSRSVRAVVHSKRVTPAATRSETAHAE